MGTRFLIFKYEFSDGKYEFSDGKYEFSDGKYELTKQLILRISISKYRQVFLLKMKDDAYSLRQVVVKSNSLIEARYRLSLQEMQVVLWLLTQIHYEDEKFKLHKLEITAFAKMAQVEVGNRYSELRKITRNLMQRVMEIYCPIENKTIQVAWLSSAEYHHQQGYVSLEFSPKLKPYLLQLKSHFTKIDIVDTLKLKSVHAIRIFELLLQYYPLGNRQIYVEDLRKCCGVEKQEYHLYSDLKRYVIEKAKIEINTKTEYEVDYEEIKQSRKVVAINWIIQKKTHFEIFQSEKAVILAKEYRSELALVERMGEYGFARLTSKKFIQNHGEETVKNALRSVDLQVERCHVKNPKAMLQTAIKEKWHPEKYVDRKKKRG